jgi:predicted tellurium resistance membrane protein TerC
VNFWTAFIGCLLGLTGAIVFLVVFIKTTAWLKSKYGEKVETIFGMAVGVIAFSALFALFASSP